MELNLQQVECDDAINQMQLSMRENEKKALGAGKRQAAKSRAVTKRHKKEGNKYNRLIKGNLRDLSVFVAIIDDLGMKVTSHLRTQDELKESHKRAMAELMSSHWSKVDDLVSTHAFNLDVEKNTLRQRISSEWDLQTVLYNEVLDSQQIKSSVDKEASSTTIAAHERLEIEGEFGCVVLHGICFNYANFYQIAAKMQRRRLEIFLTTTPHFLVSTLIFQLFKMS